MSSPTSVLRLELKLLCDKPLTDGFYLTVCEKKISVPVSNCCDEAGCDVAPEWVPSCSYLSHWSSWTTSMPWVWNWKATTFLRSAPTNGLSRRPSRPCAGQRSRVCRPSTVPLGDCTPRPAPPAAAAPQTPRLATHQLTTW